MEQQIADIASLVFWTNVQKNTFKVIRNLVLNRQFKELWIMDLLPHYLGRLNLAVDQSKNEDLYIYEFLYNKVNEYIYNSTLNEQNILGTIYLDDTIECKTNDFNEYALLKDLQQVYVDYKTTDLPSFEKVGKLLLRTPLPSIVFTNSKEIPQTFVVADTTKALGFQVNLIFDVNEIIEFPDNPFGTKYGVSGIFKIHNFKNSDFFWNKIIPNSYCYENLIIRNLSSTSNDKIEQRRGIKSPKFVTNANIKRTLKKLNTRNFDYESEIYKHNINYLNFLEKRDLLLFKCLYEFPEIFFQDYYTQIITSDNLKFVFEEQQPAYHTNNSCPNLLSNFENFLIPVQIKQNNQEIEYRNWFKQNIKLSERKILTDIFKDIHYNRWSCLPLYVDFKNSGALENINLNIDEIEQNIDNLLIDAKRYIEQSHKNNIIITKLGKSSYAYNKLETLNLGNIAYDIETISDILKTFHIDFKAPLIELLKEYYRIKYNPNLVFEENILEGLGFRQCKVCMENKTENMSNEKEILVNKILMLINDLQTIVTELDELELSLLNELDSGDESAHKVLKAGLFNARPKIIDIGKNLNSIGGIELMQIALEKINERDASHIVISSYWNGIGQWQF
jgi:hypothetical protein